jgi:outer membrane lipoprotein-sorting protein
MRCERFGADLEAFLSGELDERKTKHVQAHIDSCADCKQLLESTKYLANILKARGLCMTTPSTESNIRSKVNERITSKPQLTGRRWALVGAVVIFVMVMIGLSQMRQQSVTAAAAVIARAEAKLGGVTSYYVKYKDTSFGGRHVAYYEMWYQSPDKLKMVRHEISPASESGSSRRDIVRIVKGSSQWIYVSGSDAVFLSPISKSARRDIPMHFETPRDMLTSLGKRVKGSRYVGTQMVGERKCDVIEINIDRTHARVSIDCETGLILQSVSSENGKIGTRYDAVDIQVSKPISDDIFKPQISTDTILVMVPSTPGTLGIAPYPYLNTDADAPGLVNQLREPGDVKAELIRYGEEGAKNGARLNRLYEPDYVPEGYKFARVGQFVERLDTPIGPSGRLVPWVYSTIFIEYIDSDTGGTIVLSESVDKPQVSGSEEITSEGFEGQIITHHEPFQYIDLLWEADGVYFTLSASSMDKQEAVTIARSMQLVYP